MCYIHVYNFTITQLIVKISTEYSITKIIVSHSPNCNFLECLKLCGKQSCKDAVI